LRLHQTFQRAIEKVFFRGKSTHRSVYLTYVLANVILMLLLFYILLNRIAYDWTGQLYPVGSGFRLDFLTGGLEDSIPFVPETVIFYVYLFYPMVILTMLYFGFVEYRKGYALGWSLVLINGVAVLVYAFFPVSVYWWHQEFLAQPMVGNFWASQAYGVWAGDTTFNCFPSLHAAVSTICFYTWYRYNKVRPGGVTGAITALVLFITVGVILSTLFLKQHYVADEVAGVALALGIGYPLFDRLWRPQAPAATLQAQA